VTVQPIRVCHNNIHTTFTRCIHIFWWTLCLYSDLSSVS